MDRFTLPDELAAEMCARLGVAPPTRPDDLHELYRRWCACVPFDPVAKYAAVREGRVPPGADPIELCERWLTTGLGGTCWGHVSAFAGLVARAGVRTSIGLDRMLRDDLVDFHSFVLVDPDDGSGERWMADLVHPSGALLPFVGGATGSHPVYGTGLTQDDERLLHWYAHPEDDKHGQYVVLATDLDPADVLAFCKVSVEHTGVRGQRFFSRLTEPEAFVAARPSDDGTRLRVHRWTTAGCGETYADIDDGLAAFGGNDAGRREIEAAGLLTRDPDGTLRFTNA